MVSEKKESEDDSGFLYDLHEKMREIVSSYNDTLKGRCAVCLEKFLQQDEEEAEETEKFTERVDLVKIDQCFHRFHMICVYRDWFMPRFSEKDQFGGVVQYNLPETKRCPICRREVKQEEIDYIKKEVCAHPDLDDGGYVC